MKKKIAISVGNLVSYSFRGGDLSFDSFSMGNPREAIFAHQKIQKSRPDEYTGEVPVSYQFETDKYLLEVNGRMDGIFEYPGKVVIEEIKTTTKNIDAVIKNPNPNHWAQLKIYCYIWITQNNTDRIEGQLTYYQMESGKIEEIGVTYTKNELEIFFNDLIDRYLKRVEAIDEWLELRNHSIRQMEFPFENYRPGQRKMAVEVYSAIRNEENIIIQAATGIGKTMSTIFPAIKAMGENLSSKIFFLTARTTGKEAAENAISEMRKKGLKIKSLTITAKDKICFKTESACSPEECEFTRGYFDRVDEAIERFFKLDALSKTAIEEMAGEFQICPFEFSLELSLLADVIICDYNYVFDPRVYLRRFFLEGSMDFILLIDEAHNLVERSREMFSAEISKQDFLNTRRLLKKKLPGIYKKISKINTRLLKYRKNCDEHGSFISEEESPGEILPSLKYFLRSAEKWLIQNIVTEFREPLIELYFKVRAFVRILEDYDDNYRTLYEKNGKDLRLKLFCIDPSNRLRNTTEKIRSSVFFSATMSPAHYFKSIFGCRRESRTVEIPSPFPHENLCLVIFEGISTLYKNRERTKESAASLINPVVKSKKGNYLLFFPSYAYMKMILDTYDSDESGFETLIQSAGMSETERDDFLSRFDKDNEGTLIGFAVMGGVFGEGIDLEGERLSGAVIYGVGLPGISPEKDIIRDFFNSKDNTGFEYAYLYPGINRVLQAAGRVIRSEKDRGIVILIDDRYRSYRYKSLFPPGWRPVRVNNAEQLSKVLDKFWEM